MTLYSPADRPLCEVLRGNTWHPGEIRETRDDGWVNVKWHDGQQNRLDTVRAEYVREVDHHDAVLRFEHDHPVWKYAGAKETAIRQTFGLSSASYHQVLNAAIDDPAMLERHATTVRRLARLREKRREAR